MALSRTKTWADQEVLTHTDLNAEFDGIVNNAVDATSAMTANGFTYATASRTVASTAAATNGQLLIGSTGAAPVRATPTGQGISVTGGAGTLTLRANPTRSTEDVTTSETTTSTSYTDLATVGPDPTLSPGRATDQIILFGARLGNNNAATYSLMSVAIAGAAAADVDAIESISGNNNQKQSGHILPTSVADASTHTAKYRVTGNTGAYSNRRVSAFTLT